MPEEQPHPAFSVVGIDAARWKRLNEHAQREGRSGSDVVMGLIDAHLLSDADIEDIKKLVAESRADDGPEISLEEFLKACDAGRAAVE